MATSKKGVPTPAAAKRQAPKKQTATPAQMRRGAAAGKGKQVGKC